MRCVKILSYTIPMHGNKRHNPYGKMLIEHDREQKAVKFGDLEAGRSYIVFNRMRYYFRNEGSLYNPKFVFDGEEAVK